MVALDNTYDSPGAVRADTARTVLIVLFALLGSALLAAGALIVDRAGGFGWRLAAETVSRFSLVLFVAAMVVEPLARIFPAVPLRAIARERAGLVLAFAMAAIVSLVCVAAPSYLGGDRMSVPAVFYSAITAAILVVMLFSAHPATKRFLGAPAWRTLQRIATSYFWLVFVLTGLDHLVGPHRPDAWFGASLLILTGAVLIRFADALVFKLRGTAIVVEKTDR